RQATGRYVLYLNPDTLLPQNCLHQCLAYVAQHPQLGALGVHMIDGSGHYLPESKRAFPAPATAFFKLFGMAAAFPRSAIFARYYLGQLPPQHNHVVDVLAGAFLLAPNTVLQATGGFSQDYFMYGEDIDLSYRIQQAGLQNHYFAQSSIIHFKGESTKKGSLNYVRLFYGAMVIFVQKHYSKGSARFFSFFIQLAIALHAVGAVVLQHWRRLWQRFRPRQASTPHMYWLCGSGPATASAAQLLAAAGLAHKPLPHLQQAAPQSAIVFCFDAAHSTAPGISLQQAMAHMQQHHSGFLYHFHYAGSGNIITSCSHATLGQALLTPP
ncbi:MAG: hypothetical protein EAY75_06090, partial [Bacteroidetes bacterium]